MSTHFGTVSPLSMFSINQPLFLQKTMPLYPKSQIFIWDWDLNLGRCVSVVHARDQLDPNFLP